MFAWGVAEALRRHFPDCTTDLSDACLLERVRGGIARAIRQGATSSSSISLYVTLMFALEPEFVERHRFRQHVAANGGSLEAALVALHSWSHPNCWYRVDRSFANERWQAFVGPRFHPFLPIKKDGVLFEAQSLPQLAPAYGFQQDVPYVPTPEPRVIEMLELAQVGPDDTVLDLGSGDGRVVIIAAARFGARGIGIELNPDLVHEARLSAARAGVTDRVSFQRRDFHDADVSEATVVTMYLLRDVNLALRNRLTAQLRPGSRIVSRHFDMGEWIPRERIGSGPESIYCWHVTAPGA